MSRGKEMGRVATLLAAALLSLAPVARAATPSSQFEDFQSGLKLAVQAQRASDQGAYDQAEALDEQALPLFERALGPEDLRIVGPLASLADVYRMRGKLDRAELLYRRLAFLMEKAFGPSDIRVADALVSAAEAVVGQGHQGQAKELYARALAIRQAAVGPDSPKVLPVLSSLADVDAAIGQFEEAASLYRRARQISEKAFGPEDLAVAGPLDGEAAAETARGRLEPAEVLYRSLHRGGEIRGGRAALPPIAGDPRSQVRREPRAHRRVSGEVRGPPAEGRAGARGTAGGTPLLHCGSPRGRSRIGCPVGFSRWRSCGRQEALRLYRFEPGPSRSRFTPVAAGLSERRACSAGTRGRTTCLWATAPGYSTCKPTKNDAYAASGSLPGRRAR